MTNDNDNEKNEFVLLCQKHTNRLWRSCTYISLSRNERSCTCTLTKSKICTRCCKTFGTSSVGTGLAHCLVLGSTAPIKFERIKLTSRKSHGLKCPVTLMHDIVQKIVQRGYVLKFVGVQPASNPIYTWTKSREVCKAISAFTPVVLMEKLARDQRVSSNYAAAGG